MSSTIHCWVRGSSAAVGSSKSSTSGFITRTDAIATRFFSPPESWYGARSARSVMSSMASVSSMRATTSSRVEAHVEGSERDLVADRRREHLGVGVLEDEPDAAAEAARELFVLEVVFGDVGAERAVGAGVGEQQTVEQLEQRRLPAAVRTEQRDLLARVDRQRHAVERGEPPEVRVLEVAALAGAASDRRLSRGHGHPTTRGAPTTQQASAPNARSSRRSSSAASASGRRRCTPVRPSPCTPLPRARAPCRRVHPPTRRRTADPFAMSRSVPTVRARRAVYMSLDRGEQVEQVAVRHRQHEDHRRRQTAAIGARQADRVPRRGDGQEHDERDRHRDPHDDQPRRLEALGGEPDRACRTRCPSGTTIVTRRDQVQRGREHDDAGEDRARTATPA